MNLLKNLLKLYIFLFLFVLCWGVFPIFTSSSAVMAQGCTTSEDCAFQQVCEGGECKYCHTEYCPELGYDNGVCGGCTSPDCHPFNNTCIYDCTNTGFTCSGGGNCWCLREESCDCDVDVCTESGCCTPMCNWCGNGLTCGDDGCGGSCGTCPSNTHCFIGCCDCDAGYDNCDGDWSNGCETNTNTDEDNCGECGNECASDETCDDGECVEHNCCTSYMCDGGSCIPYGESCCVGDGCVPDCNVECTTDEECSGCEDDSDCGTGELCCDGICETECQGDESWILDSCGECGGSVLCEDDEKSCYYYKDCYVYHSTLDCVTPGKYQCDPCCTPDCDGKECGDDGCGGSCGSCGSGETCENGICVDSIVTVDCASECSTYDNWQCTPEGCDMLGWPYTGGCSGGTCYYGLTNSGLCEDGTTCCCWNEDPCDCGTDTCDDTGCHPPEAVCGDGTIDAGEECDPNASPDGCGAGESCSDSCVCETDSCVCDGCVDAYDCGPKTFYGTDCDSCPFCDADSDCEGCGNGTVEGPEECDPPGSTTSCTMPNGCPGVKTCDDSCSWGSCVQECSWGYCPHDECNSYCPSPNCSADYSCGFDECSSDYGCSDGCDPNTTECTECIAPDGCEGKQDCDSEGCLGSCYRDNAGDCCSSGYCPYDDCSDGACESTEACGTDQCSGDSDCRHYECLDDCPDYCDLNCNCDEGTSCYLSYDDTANVDDECCQGLLCLCTYGESEGYECTWATDRGQCCQPSCPSPAECSAGSGECCGQGDGCDGTCSDCDVSDGDLDSPENLSPGTEDSSLPQRIRTSNTDVLDPSALSQTLTWADGDLGNGCNGATRTDSFPIRLDKDPDSWSGDCGSLNAGDECGEPDVSSPSYTFSADIGSTYHWWVHARNETCASYTDCCGDNYTGVDDWSAVSEAYVCRPDCRPELCGQNDNCGAEQTLEGFNGFDGADDDCPATQNGNPDSAYQLSSSLDGADFYESSGLTDPAVLDPESPAQISRPVTVRWEFSDPLAQDAVDEVQVEIYRIGDPATDPNWTNFNWGAAGVGSTEVGADLGTGLYNYNDLCGPSAGNAPNVCTFTYDSADHHIVYGWRAAHHNVTCEALDASNNVGEAFGQVDTLDPDSCDNDELCGADGERDWSVWAEGYFIIDNLPTAVSVTPSGGDRWSGGDGSNSNSRNPENQYYDWGVDSMPAVWEWEDDWTAPSDKPVSYCQDNDCEDITLQNNPQVFEVVYEDLDGWEDFYRLHFTFNSVGQDCAIAGDPSGDATSNLGRYGRLERTDYAAGCPSDSVCENVSLDDGGTSGDWTLLDGKIARVNDHQVRGYFKVQFNNSAYFQYHGGQIKLCADVDDYYTADDETRWLGDPYGGRGSWNVYGTPDDETDDWSWKVDMRAPELDIDSDDPANGNEIKDLMMVDVDGSAPPCDPATQVCDESIYDTWAYEVQLALREFNFTGAEEEESGLYADSNNDKLAPDGSGDGVTTLDEREDDSEEPELSVLAWYWNNYDDYEEDDCSVAQTSIGSEWEWIRLDSVSAVASDYPFYYEVDSFDTDKAVVTLYIPAEDEDEKIDGMCYQRTKEVRLQIRDGAGNVHARAYTLFPGWLQAVNGDLYSRAGVDFTGLHETYIDQDMYDPFLLTSEPLPPNGSGSCGEQTSGGLVLGYPGSTFVLGGDLGQGVNATERPECVAGWVNDGYVTDALTDFEELLGFDWVSLYSAAADTGGEWGYAGGSGNLRQLTPGNVYTYDSYDEDADGGNGAYIPLEGEYKLNGDGVAVVYVGDGDGVGEADEPEDHLVIGDRDSTNETSFYNSSYNSKGVIIIVEGGVKVEDDVDRIDAFIISLGAFSGHDESIVFPITKYVSGDPLIVHGSLIAAEGFSISRYIFDIYEPVLQVRLNTLYQNPASVHSLMMSANHSWMEEE